VGLCLYGRWGEPTVHVALRYQPAWPSPDCRNRPENYGRDWAGAARHDAKRPSRLEPAPAGLRLAPRRARTPGPGCLWVAASGLLTISGLPTDYLLARPPTSSNALLQCTAPMHCSDALCPAGLKRMFVRCQIYTNKCLPSSGTVGYHVEHMFDSQPGQGYDAGSNAASSMAMSCGHLSETEESALSETLLTGKRREILDFIAEQVRERGYPPSVREIGLAVGLASTSTVQAHLNTLQRQGYLRRDPTKPRALEVRYDATSGAAIERRPARHVPLVGDIAAGTNVLASENVEELLPLPDDFTGGGSLFMLRVRGDSMVEAGILDGDYVVVRQQPDALPGDVVAAGIPGEEATVKTFSKRGDEVVLLPANPSMAPLEFPASEVTIYGKVVTVLRRL